MSLKKICLRSCGSFFASLHKEPHQLLLQYDYEVARLEFLKYNGAICEVQQKTDIEISQIFKDFTSCCYILNYCIGLKMPKQLLCSN